MQWHFIKKNTKCCQLPFFFAPSLAGRLWEPDMLNNLIFLHQSVVDFIKAFGAVAQGTAVLTLCGTSSLGWLPLSWRHRWGIPWRRVVLGCTTLPLCSRERSCLGRPQPSPAVMKGVIYYVILLWRTLGAIVLSYSAIELLGVWVTCQVNIFISFRRKEIYFTVYVT